MTDQEDAISFENLMEKIVLENSILSNNASVCDEHPFKGAEFVVDKYLNIPVSQRCLEFWYDYSKSTNAYEKKLAEQA